MIVIKRDGQEVNYNRSKIIVAIGKDVYKRQLVE